MKTSDYIAQLLKKHNIKCVFGYQGANIAHLIDSIQTAGISYLQNYHEQASAFAACSYAQITGNIGVAVASSGPGAINLINGIANAYYDSIPCLFITGQVSQHIVCKQYLPRQWSFQESDIVSIVSPIVKFAVQINNCDDVGEIFEKAISIAKSGRPGPVLIDLPHNIQTSPIELLSLSQMDSAKNLYQEDSPDIHDDEILMAVELMKNSTRPLILVGGGAASLRTTNCLTKLVHRASIPVVASLMGLDVFPHDDPHYLGFIGDYGNRCANIAVARCDLLIVLGSRLDVRQTGIFAEQFAYDAKIIHVDIDANELQRVKKEALSIRADSGHFVKLLAEKVMKEQRIAWLGEINFLKGYFENSKYAKEEWPNTVIREITSALPDGSILCGDVGQNQMWLAQSAQLPKNGRILNSGGLGSMGYSLPAAIGAAMSSAFPVYCFSGDGGLQMNIQELQTIVREQLNVKIILFNNTALGLIREYQEKALQGRYGGSVKGYTNPNFKELSKAYGLEYCKIDALSNISSAINLLLKTAPSVCEVFLSETTVVSPGPAAKRPVYDQTPLLDSDILTSLIDGRSIIN